VVDTKDQVFERNNKDEVIYLSIWGTSTEIDGNLEFEVIDVVDIVTTVNVEAKTENTDTQDG
tara:strand:- start:430 stop:615 length:186 start_codon:yes stop_codon:yes gene_type:complete